MDRQTVTAKARLGRFVSIIMLMTGLSRLFGFVRDIILAQIFGATAAFDAFVIAFKIPNFMRRLFGEGAFSQAFIPILVKYRTEQGTHGVSELINHMTGVLGVILLGIVIVGEISAPLLVWIFAPGFSRDPHHYQLAIHLVRITFPYLLSIGLVALAGAIFNTYNRFALTAFTPVLLNVVLITVAVFWIPHVQASHAVMVLAWGVALSGVLQLIIQWPGLQHLGLLPKPVWEWQDPGVRKVFKRLLPALLGVSLVQISLLINNLFASFLPAGSISWLYYSDRLLYFPLGMIGVTLATAIMPHLAHHHQNDTLGHFNATMDWAFRCILAAAVPAALGLLLLAGPILAVLMHHGAFTARDVEMTKRSLMAFATGLPALVAIKVLAAAFYARHNVRTPACIAGIALLFNIILNIVLISPLAHAGLALATALASWLNAVLLWLFLHRRQGFHWRPGWLRVSVGVTAGCLLMIAALWWGSDPLASWLDGNIGKNAVRLMELMALGVVAYLLGLWTAGLRWRHFKLSGI